MVQLTARFAKRSPCRTVLSEGMLSGTKLTLRSCDLFWGFSGTLLFANWFSFLFTEPMSSWFIPFSCRADLYEYNLICRCLYVDLMWGSLELLTSRISINANHYSIREEQWPNGYCSGLKIERSWLERWLGTVVNKVISLLVPAIEDMPFIHVGLIALPNAVFFIFSKITSGSNSLVFILNSIASLTFNASEPVHVSNKAVLHSFFRS